MQPLNMRECVSNVWVFIWGNFTKFLILRLYSTSLVLKIKWRIVIPMEHPQSTLMCSIDFFVCSFRKEHPNSRAIIEICQHCYFTQEFSLCVVEIVPKSWGCALFLFALRHSSEMCWWEFGLEWFVIPGAWLVCSDLWSYHQYLNTFADYSKTKEHEKELFGVCCHSVFGKPLWNRSQIIFQVIYHFSEGATTCVGCVVVCGVADFRVQVNYEGPLMKRLNRIDPCDTPILSLPREL